MRHCKFSKKKIYSKLIFSKTIRRMKLKFGIHAYEMTLYIFFYCQCPTAFIAMATSSFCRLITGKMEIGNFCCRANSQVSVYRTIDPLVDIINKRITFRFTLIIFIFYHPNLILLTNNNEKVRSFKSKEHIH